MMESSISTPLNHMGASLHRRLSEGILLSATSSTTPTPSTTMHQMLSNTYNGPSAPVTSSLSSALTPSSSPSLLSSTLASSITRHRPVNLASTMSTTTSITPIPPPPIPSSTNIIPPLTYTPSLRTKAAQGWYRMEEQLKQEVSSSSTPPQKNPPSYTAGDATNHKINNNISPPIVAPSRPIREVDSRTSHKLSGQSSSSSLHSAAAGDTHSPNHPALPPGYYHPQGPQHYHNGRLIVRRLDPSAPIPRRPSGLPPNAVQQQQQEEHQSRQQPPQNLRLFGPPAAPPSFSFASSASSSPRPTYNKNARRSSLPIPYGLHVPPGFRPSSHPHHPPYIDLPQRPQTDHGVSSPSHQQQRALPGLLLRQQQQQQQQQQQASFDILAARGSGGGRGSRPLVNMGQGGIGGGGAGGAGGGLLNAPLNAMMSIGGAGGPGGGGGGNDRALLSVRREEVEAVVGGNEGGAVGSGGDGGSAGWDDQAEEKETLLDELSSREPCIWSEFWDEEVEASYYYNRISGEASWIKPEAYDGDHVMTSTRGAEMIATAEERKNNHEEEGGVVGQMNMRKGVVDR